jgi:hypothetical protein
MAVILTQTQLEAIPILAKQPASSGLVVRKLNTDGKTWIRLTYGAAPDGQGNWPITYDEVTLLNFAEPDPVNFKGTTVGAQTIDLATFQVPQNILGKTRIEVLVVDTGNGNSDMADVTVHWKRFTNGVIVVRTVQVIPLAPTGTLVGLSLPPLAIVGNTIVSRFTGLANRTIDVYARFTPTILKF